jgi:hypothetical protein
MNDNVRKLSAAAPVNLAQTGCAVGRSGGLYNL